MLVVGIKLIVRKMGFHKIGCLRQGISNCQCPRNRVSQKLDVYFLGYIIFWVLFLGFLQFQLLFLGFSQAFGLGLGAVLEVLEITAPQVLPTVCAINLWLLNIMLI